MTARTIIRLAALTSLACGVIATPGFAQTGAKPSDPQIAHIAYTAGNIDIAQAKQAIGKASNKDVKAFAEDMVRDHEAVNKQALDLVKKKRTRRHRLLERQRSNVKGLRPSCLKLRADIARNWSLLCRMLYQEPCIRRLMPPWKRLA